MTMKRRLVALAMCWLVAACGDGAPAEGGKDQDATAPGPRPEDGGAQDGATHPDAFEAGADASSGPPDAAQAPDAAAGDAATDGTADDAGPRGADAGDVDAGPKPCDPVAQTGCEADEKCTSSMGVVACKPNGTKAAGEACTASQANDNCRAGTACQTGKCRQICAPDAETCLCSKVAGFFQDVDLGLCQTRCSPTLQDCGDDKEACFHVGYEGDSACLPSNGVANGQACAYSNDCIAGHDCLISNPETGEPMCARQCNPTASGGCAKDSVCMALNELVEVTTFPASEGICVPCAHIPDAEGCQ
jgi:hypothetical protein